MEAAAEKQKRLIERDRLLAYNAAALTGLAFVGKLKTFDEHFPPSVEAEQSQAGLSPEGAKILGALFKLKRKGVVMTFEKITRH